MCGLQRGFPESKPLCLGQRRRRHSAGPTTESSNHARLREAFEQAVITMHAVMAMRPQVAELLRPELKGHMRSSQKVPLKVLLHRRATQSGSVPGSVTHRIGALRDVLAPDRQTTATSDTQNVRLSCDTCLNALGVLKGSPWSKPRAITAADDYSSLNMNVLTMNRGCYDISSGHRWSPLLSMSVGGALCAVQCCRRILLSVCNSRAQGSQDVKGIKVYDNDRELATCLYDVSDSGMLRRDAQSRNT